MTGRSMQSDPDALVAEFSSRNIAFSEPLRDTDGGLGANSTNGYLGVVQAVGPIGTRNGEKNAHHPTYALPGSTNQTASRLMSNLNRRESRASC